MTRKSMSLKFTVVFIFFVETEYHLQLICTYLNKLLVFDYDRKCIH